MDNAVRKEYGRALFLLAKEENRVDELGEQIKTLRSLFKDEPGYMKLILSPQIKTKEREKVLDDAFSGAVDVYLLNFMKLLLKNRHFSELIACCEEYEQLALISKSTVRAKAVSAVELSAQQKAALEEKLGEKYEVRVELECVVDESLIGGVRVEIFDEVIDGSVKAKIKNIREKLLNTSI